MKSCDLFAKRDTLEEALSYAETVTRGLPEETRLPVTTALWVVLNTALAELEKEKAHRGISLPASPSYASPSAPVSIDKLSPEEAAALLPPAIADFTTVLFFLDPERAHPATRLATQLITLLLHTFRLDQEAFKVALESRVDEVMK